MPLRGKRAVLNEYRKKADELPSKLAVEAAESLIDKTPVDTGRTKANWNVSVGQPDTSTTDATDKSGGATKARAKAAAANAKAGDTVCVTNSLPHVPGLEHGDSSKAPQGMVAVTRAELPHRFARLVRRIRGR